MWIMARPAGDSSLIPASQLLHGELGRATRLLRAGGWAAVSNGFAAEHHLELGRSFTLPTPAGPARFAVAAITTNLGWSPGAVIINSVAYRHYWQTAQPTALEVNLRPGVSEAAGRHAVAQALGPTARTRHPDASGNVSAQYDANVAPGTERAERNRRRCCLIAAALAVAAALSASIWQRRAAARLAEDPGLRHGHSCGGRCC